MRRALQAGCLTVMLLVPQLARADTTDAPDATTRVRSPLMLGTGVAMLTVGTIGAAVTSPLLYLFDRTTTVGLECPMCGSRTTYPDRGTVTALTTGVVASALTVLAGIPLVIAGARERRANHAALWITPGGIAGRF